MLTPKRIYEEELLDAGAGTDDDVAQNLLDLRRINRLLGGTRVVLNTLAAAVKGQSVTRLSLLDVGTGSADIPSAVAGWCQSRGIEPMVVALDISARNLRVARTKLGIGGGLELVQADSLRLPFKAKSVDYVTASLFLHHFNEADIVALLRDFARVAARGVIINDLVRNLIPYYFMRFTGPVFATSFLTRNDGPVSVLRGFTQNELAAMARQAGLGKVRVQRAFPYRLSLFADTRGVTSDE